MNQNAKNNSATHTTQAASKGPQIESPFTKATSLACRLLLFLWGTFGSGKTFLGLQFPNVVAIDLEGGTDHYGDKFNFDRINSADPDELARIILWLRRNEHSYQTLLIDPITIFWESLQNKWSEIYLKRNKSSKGFKFEYFDFQPRDWMFLKAEFKRFLRSLIALDMNVIVTARQKVQYADGAFMQVIGDTFDCERTLPYMFDTIVRLYRDEKGRFLSHCLKDRTGKLPTQPFETSYATYEQFFGKAMLRRKPNPVAVATDDQIKSIEKCIAKLQLPPEVVQQRLQTYGVKQLADLDERNAKTVLEKLEAACATQEQARKDAENGEV